MEQNILLVLAEVEESIKAEGPNLEGLYEIRDFLEGVLWDLQNEEN